MDKGLLGIERGLWAKIGVLAKMGTGKGLLGINKRFQSNGDLGECAGKGIGAKMRLLLGKEDVLGKGHLGRNRGIWGKMGFKGK